MEGQGKMGWGEKRMDGLMDCRRNQGWRGGESWWADGIYVGTGEAAREEDGWRDWWMAEGADER